VPSSRCDEVAGEVVDRGEPLGSESSQQLCNPRQLSNTSQADATPSCASMSTPDKETRSFAKSGTSTSAKTLPIASASA
jgi:hypothetical protein